MTYSRIKEMDSLNNFLYTLAPAISKYELRIFAIPSS